jgi:hypothetical protein
MKKCYFVNDKEYSWIELINLASDLDDDFNNSYIKTTSKAAEVLRESGLKVTTYKED